METPIFKTKEPFRGSSMPWLHISNDLETFLLQKRGKYRQDTFFPLMIIYVCRNGVEIGQYTRQDFEYLLSRDRLFHTDHFWSEGMEEWKPLSAAKSYLCQREKCRHCGAKMSEHKLVTSGARIGQMKCICRKCGHAEYHAASEVTEEPAPELAGQSEQPPESESAHEEEAAEMHAAAG